MGRLFAFVLTGLLVFTQAHKLHAQVTASFTATPTSGCLPMVVSFTNNSTGASSYSWSFGNSTSSTAASPTTSYTVAGTYTVTLTATGASGSATATTTIIVKQPPAFTTSASSMTVCPGVNVSFAANSMVWNSAGGGTYLWDFGDGATSTAASPSHAWVSGGSYNTVLTATNSAGCPRADTLVISVYTKPNAAFNASDTAICTIGGSTTFSAAAGSGNSYYWDFGDGTNSSSAPPVSHSYSIPGYHTVKLIVTDANGCTDTVKKNNYIHVVSVSAGMTGPSSACPNVAISFSASSATSSGAAISWDFGDGTGTFNGSSMGHSYLSSGTYTVTMTATIGGCSTPVTQSITVNPRPSAAFSINPALPCPSPAAVTFTASTITGTNTYAWDYGDGFTGSGGSSLHTYTSDSAFDVRLTVTNSAGCTASVMQTLTIYPMRHTVSPSHLSGCAPMLDSFKDAVIALYPPLMLSGPYPSPSVSWSWNFGDGATSPAATPVHTYLHAGSYLVTESTTTANGCTVTDTIRVAFGDKPTAHFGQAQTVACVNEPLYFYDSSISNSPGFPVNSWLWDFGLAGQDISENPTVYFPTGGSYTVSLIARVNGCPDTIIKPLLITINWPKASMRAYVSCDTPGLLHFIDSSINATSINWYFGDGTSSSSANPAHQYLPGIYTAMITAYNSTTGCHDTARRFIDVRPLNISITASDSTVCRGDTIHFAAVNTGTGPVNSYIWWVGSGVNPIFPVNFMAQTFDSTFSSSGIFSVAVHVQDVNGCAHIVQRTNYIVVGPPQISIRAVPSIGCAPVTVVFTDSSIYAPSTYAISRWWDFGDGTSTNTGSQSLSHSYSNAGSYDISFSVTDNLGCLDTQTYHAFVKVYKPQAIWNTTSTNACLGVPFNFFSSSTGQGLTYLWHFGDGTSSTASSPTHSYATTGTYTITLIVTDLAGCRDSLIRAAYVTVKGPPAASFTMSDTLNICPPMVVNFTNTSSGAVSYNWSFGNTGSSTLINPTSTYTNPGVYTIRLIAKNNAGCVDTAYGRVRVLGYRGVLSYAPLFGCSPLTVTFHANNVQAVPGFIYDFDDGSPIVATTNTTITHTYYTVGPHVPNITMTDNLGCSAVSIGLDTIKIDGVVHGYTYNPYPACGDGGTFTFVDTSHALYSALTSTLWRFHDGSTSTSATPSFHYFSAGGYTITLYHSTSFGCKDTMVSTFHLYPIPSIDAGHDTTICITDAAILNPSGGVSYNWTPSGTLSCANCEHPAARPVVRTIYTVVGTDVHGCTNKDTVSVAVKTKVVAELSDNREICEGDTVQLFASGAASYTWTPPTGLSRSDTSSPYASPVTTQHYTVISRFASCIPDTDYVDVVVHPRPTVDAGRSQTMIAGNSVQLNATGSSFVTSWSWTPELGLSCAHCTDPLAAPTHTTVYMITANTEFGCRVADTVTVFVVCDGSQAFVPNTFTPDGNGVNDVFYPRGKGVQRINTFRIYNRWGEVVFDKKDIAIDDRAQGWDGRMNGQLLTPDVYVYLIEATCVTGEALKWQGDVLLLR